MKKEYIKLPGFFFLMNWHEILFNKSMDIVLFQRNSIFQAVNVFQKAKC